MPQTKEQEKSPEKELNKMEARSLSDTEFRESDNKDVQGT